MDKVQKTPNEYSEEDGGGWNEERENQTNTTTRMTNGSTNGSHMVSASRLIVRESVFLLGMRYIVLFVTLLIINVISSLIIIGSGLYFLFSFLIVFDLLSILMSIYIFLQWKNHFFVISYNGIRHKRGVWDKHEENYSCDNVETIMLDQSWFGRLFRFGTIKLYDPALQANIILYNIHSPRKIAKLMRRIYLNIEKNERAVLVRGSLSA